MDLKPNHEKGLLDLSFPFRMWDAQLKEFPYHWHESQELVYVKRGTIYISVNGQTYCANKGDFIVINNNFIHNFFDSSADIALVICQFSLQLFDQSLVDLRDRNYQNLIFDRKVLVSKNTDGSLHKKLEKLFLAMQREYEAKNEGWRLAIKSGLYEIALVFLREIPPSGVLQKQAIRPNYNRHIMERVFAFLHSEYSDCTLGLEEASGIAALSKCYFSRYFKSQTGETFHHYLARIRVMQASEHLTNSDMPVTDVAYNSGFGSIKTFNRIFKTFTGVSPSDYRVGHRR
jgi:AraC-like DNA-binding protein